MDEKEGRMEEILKAITPTVEKAADDQGITKEGLETALNAAARDAGIDSTYIHVMEFGPANHPSNPAGSSDEMTKVIMEAVKVGVKEVKELLDGMEATSEKSYAEGRRLALRSLVTLSRISSDISSIFLLTVLDHVKDAIAEGRVKPSVEDIIALMKAAKRG